MTASTVPTKIFKAILVLLVVGGLWGIANLAGFGSPPESAEAKNAAWRAEQSEKRAAQAEVAAVKRDVTQLRLLGTQAVNAGVAVEYDISVWSKALDVTTSSLMPGDARAVADAICTAARGNFIWSLSYKVRVFLPIGDRPAAVCTI